MRRSRRSSGKVGTMVSESAMLIQNGDPDLIPDDVAEPIKAQVTRGMDQNLL